MLQQNSLLSAIWQQNRLRISLIMIFLLIIICIFVTRNWVVSPYLKNLHTSQLQLQQQVRQRQVEFSNNGIPVSVAGKIEKNLRQFHALIPKQEYFSQFLGELFAWAQDSGLGIHQINYEPEADTETGFFRYRLDFSVEGNYAQLKKFLYLLENSKRLLIIDKISLSGANTHKKRENVNLKIKLSTFFQERSA